MILKIMTSLVIVGCSTMLGMEMANRHVYRSKEIRIFQAALIQLESEILYYDTLLPDALKQVGDAAEGEIGRFFRNTATILRAQRGTSVAEAWKEALQGARDLLHIHSDEYESIMRFGDQLGLSDKEGQRKYFGLIQSQLKSQEIKAEEDRAKYVRMYRSLGLLGGLALAIILL